MSRPSHEDTTVLLRRAAAGDVGARDRVWSRLYDEVLFTARAQRSRWSGSWTLETRAVAHEVFIKLFAGTPVATNDRKHFFTLLSKAARQILVNYSEASSAAKRGGGVESVTLNEESGVALDPQVSAEILDLNDALERFAQLDERAAKVVELRFFAGLTYDEIAETLEIARATAVRDWEAARDWLNLALTDPADPSGEDGAPKDDVMGRLGEALDQSLALADSPERWIGAEVGGYRLVELLGRGGMGAVYRGEAAGHNPVAVKLLGGAFPTRTARRRFEREGDRLEGLRHPGIAALLGRGALPDGEPYYVMELVEGEPIDVYADSRRLDIDARLELVQRVADAVGHAHEHDIVHRDLKPSNVLVRDSGSPMLLDFGIAKLLDPMHEGRPATLTLEALAYTPGYSSPEQVAGEPVSPASDVYSLGAIAYTLLAGAPPPIAIRRDLRTLVAVFDSLIEQHPALAASRSATPDRIRAELAGELGEIIERACAMPWATRYASVAAFTSEIGRYVAEGEGGREAS